MVRLGVAMVPETRDVFPDLTVAENLKLGAFTRRRDAAGVAEDRARVVALFPVLGERAGQPAGTLSGGEQQMLVIARALMSRPRLLLLDEPSLGLAPAIIERIFEMIAELKRSGLTILLVEQNAAQGAGGRRPRLCHAPRPDRGERPGRGDPRRDRPQGALSRRLSA